ncbi:response regulator [Haloimpatiens lingqiaonensis]|uniref:response regulator n=1 Tax=Haloimpatiens lingqiaonensis TaxID=1380675 RepID=UPI0010FE1812|nr:response regulator [Haloimpatiens lingqiaonensis]
MENLKILIVEDDININNMIKEALCKEGYEVEQAFHGLEGVEKFVKYNYNMVILDIMMPVMDGIEAMGRIRQKSKVPIIILSAKGEDSDKIIGLGMGADDYIVKPFSVPELIARVKSNIRRSIYYNEREANIKDKVYKYGNVEFNLNNYIVLKEGKELAMSIYDRGKGIEKSQISQIFNRLYTQEKSRNRKLQGSGLGLTIVKKLVEGMNGSIEVQSIPYDKTSFIITLPKAN